MSIQELVNEDETFSESAFISKVDNTFIMLFSSVMMQDMLRVKHKISDELYNIYKNKVDRLINSNERQMYDELNIKSTNINYVTKSNDKYLIGVNIIARYMDYIVDKETNKYKRGTNDHRIEVTYNLVFEKSVYAKKEGIIKKCSTCGASMDVNNTGKCIYCGSIYNTEKYDWVLVDIR